MPATAAPFWFLDFFTLLRRKGVKVSLNEWMTFLEGLKRGLHDHTLSGLYELGRMVLVKNEADLDTYDVVFRHYFHEMELPPLPDIKNELLEWLENAASRRSLSEEDARRLLEERDHSLEALLKEFDDLLEKQDGRHDRGNRWIGTGGTSPFGQSGALPQPGIRVGGEAGARSAIAMAGERRFKDYRNDLTLDIRQIQSALKTLRQLARDGAPEELDLDETIEATGRNAGDLELIFHQSRKNSVKVLLIMDSGGSMSPYAHLCNQLFSAAHQLNHFKDFQHFYFHNCPYHYVYRDSWQDGRVAVQDLMMRYDPSYKVIFVGDACMAPYELLHSWYGDGLAGYEYLEMLRRHYKRMVWLNPEPRRAWGHETIMAVGKLIPMFPLTLTGLKDAVAELLVRGAVR